MALSGQLSLGDGSDATAAPVSVTAPSSTRTPKWFSMSGTMPRGMAAASRSSGSSTLMEATIASAASFSKYFFCTGPGGGCDGAQLAPRQRRLEQVGGVALAGLLSTRADDGGGLYR